MSSPFNCKSCGASNAGKGTLDACEYCGAAAPARKGPPAMSSSAPLSQAPVNDLSIKVSARGYVCRDCCGYTEQPVADTGSVQSGFAVLVILFGAAGLWSFGGWSLLVAIPIAMFLYSKVTDPDICGRLCKLCGKKDLVIVTSEEGKKLFFSKYTRFPRFD